MLARHQGVDLCRRQRGVAQQHLQGTQVGPAVEQVGGEAVPQAVRADPAGIDAGSGRVMLDQRPEGLPGRRQPLCIDEQRLRNGGIAQAGQQRRARLAQVALQPVLGFLAQRDQPVLAALAGHPQHALAQVDRGRRQANQFAHAQAAGIHQFQHRAIAQPGRGSGIGRFQQRRYLRLRQRLGQQARQVRRLQQGAGIVAAQAQAHRVRVERMQGGQQSGIAARLVAGPAAHGQVVEQVAAHGQGQSRRGRSALQPTRQPLQVAAVGRERRGRKPLLCPGGIEEALDRGSILVRKRGQRTGNATAIGGGAHCAQA